MKSPPARIVMDPPPPDVVEFLAISFPLRVTGPPAWISTVPASVSPETSTIPFAAALSTTTAPVVWIMIIPPRSWGAGWLPRPWTFPPEPIVKLPALMVMLRDPTSSVPPGPETVTARLPKSRMQPLAMV